MIKLIILTALLVTLIALFTFAVISLRTETRTSPLKDRDKLVLTLLFCIYAIIFLSVAYGIFSIIFQ